MERIIRRAAVGLALLATCGTVVLAGPSPARADTAADYRARYFTQLKIPQAHAISRGAPPHDGRPPAYAPLPGNGQPPGYGPPPVPGHPPADVPHGHRPAQPGPQWPPPGPR